MFDPLIRNWWCWISGLGRTYRACESPDDPKWVICGISGLLWHRVTPSSIGVPITLLLIQDHRATSDFRKNPKVFSNKQSICPRNRAPSPKLPKKDPLSTSCGRAEWNESGRTRSLTRLFPTEECFAYATIRKETPLEIRTAYWYVYASIYHTCFQTNSIVKFQSSKNILHHRQIYELLLPTCNNIFEMLSPRCNSQSQMLCKYKSICECFAGWGLKQGNDGWGTQVLIGSNDNNAILQTNASRHQSIKKQVACYCLEVCMKSEWGTMGRGG
jgi:hypothetical protein